MAEEEDLGGWVPELPPRLPDGRWRPEADPDAGSGSAYPPGGPAARVSPSPEVVAGQADPHSVSPLGSTPGLGAPGPSYPQPPEAVPERPPVGPPGSFGGPATGPATGPVIAPPAAYPPGDAASPSMAPVSGAQGKGARRWIAVAVVAAVIGAAVGAGVTRAVGGSSHSTTTVLAVKPGPALLANDASVPAIVRRVLPAVVTIKAEGPGSGAGATVSPFGETSPFGASPSFGAAPEVVDEGTGMIITTSGEVVTNNHVIAGATRITVTLYGKRHSVPAKLVGADPTDDVALLQIENPPANLPTVTFGRSSLLVVGDAVIAIGNALGLSAGTPTVTSGIISALGRSVSAGSATGTGPTEHLTDMIQTDAAINSGNSGGPLVDSAGQVVGMNTAVASSSAGNAPAQNIGFAIPSDHIESLLPILRRGGTVQSATAFLGVEILSMSPELRAEYGFVPNHGAVVAGVVAGSPASAAGIEEGDVIVGFDGKTITSAQSLVTAVQAAKAGQSAQITLWRGQEKMTLTVTLASAPAS